jgi:serine/threonine protein kinase
MDANSDSGKTRLVQRDGDSFTFKRVPHVMILPDGSKPVQLGSGTITGLLGVGGMANVYEIWNTQLEMKRAVKLLHPNYSPEAKQRFETEIKITAKLDHPNIVEIHAVGEWNGLPYIEMEKIEGETLEKLVSDRGGLPFDVCTSIGIMVCRALRYAHNHQYALYGETYHGIIHRDLKPNNIMVAATGNVKLMDFGIARPIDASIHTTDNTSVLGTLQYLSPEMLEGKTADIRTDIYSLGAILYELVTGAKAFAESNISKLMISKARNEFKPLDAFAISIPPRLKRIVQRCLNRERERRPQDAAALLAELTRVHKSLTPLSPEAVMQSFTGSEIGGKTVIGIRRLLPVRTLAMAVIAIALVVTLAATLHSVNRRHVRAVAASAPGSMRAAPVAAAEPTFVHVRDRLSSAPKKASKLSITVERPVAPPPSRQTSAESLLNVLSSQYGTTDPLDLFVKTVRMGKYGDAQTVYETLTAQQRQSRQAMLCRLRMLDARGDAQGLKNMLQTSSVDDGEFYLAEAKFLYGAGNLERCLYFLDVSSKTRSELMSPVVVKQDILFYRALCYSKEFDEHPGQATMKNALDAWFEVKLQLRSAPESNYYRKAVSEMQRIADKSKFIRG